MRDESAIVELLAAADVRGLRMVFDAYYRGLCALAICWVNDADTAEDIVRDELVSFWERKRGTRQVRNVKAYLYGTVRNAVSNWLRDHNRLVFSEMEHSADIDPEEFDRMESDEQERRKALLHSELEALPPRTRAVFDAIALDELPYKEAAQRLGISVNTVKTLYARALHALRKHIYILFL